MNMLNDLHNLTWQNFYYATCHSWMPLSLLPSMQEQGKLKEIKPSIELTECELLQKSILKFVSASEQVTIESTERTFYTEIANYMLRKETCFEIALKRTHALKVYQHIYYRKSRLKGIIEKGINEYHRQLKLKYNLQRQYQFERSKQVKELLQVVESLDKGNESVEVSKGLLTTLLYRQLIGYNVSLDKLASDSLEHQTIQSMKEKLYTSELRHWSESDG